ARVADRPADQLGPGEHRNLGHAVAGGDRQPLPHVDVGEVGLVGDVVHDRARDVQLGRRLDALQAGGGVDLHDEWPVTALEHVDAGHPQAHDVRAADGDLGVGRVQVDGLDRPAAVDVGAELLA